MTLLLLLLACKGIGDDSVSRRCEQARIEPGEACNPELWRQYRCATCDPAQCENCPASWYCTQNNDDDWAWQNSSMDCDCISANGYPSVGGEECEGDSE